MNKRKFKPKVCENCGTDYTPSRAGQRYCSRKCFSETRQKKHTCETCGKVFYNNDGVNRFCSYECLHNAPSTLIEVACIQCNKPFKMTRHRLEKYNSKFCSRSCLTAHAWITFPCHVCGKDIRMRRSAVKARQKKNKYDYIFCSLECLGKVTRGDNHHNWQGGHRKWRGQNWQVQAPLARERDNHTCQRCGITEEKLGKPLDVHHIIPWRKFDNDWIKANDLSNLTSLCPRCHTTVERRLHGPTRRRRHNRTNPHSEVS